MYIFRGAVKKKVLEKIGTFSEICIRRIPVYDFFIFILLLFNAQIQKSRERESI